jgi:hypothetical protein
MLKNAKVSVFDVRWYCSYGSETLTENEDNHKYNNKTYLIQGPKALFYHQMAFQCNWNIFEATVPYPYYDLQL